MGTIVHDGDSNRGSKRRKAVLIVGTLGGGGIHRYIEDQRDQLDDRFDVSVYDMRSNPKGQGAVWFLRWLVLALVAVLRFPFRSRPDVVHVHTSHWFSFYRAAPYVLFAAYVWRLPVVLHIHGSSFDEFVATESLSVSWLQRLVFAASSEVVVLSAYWRDVLGDVVDTEKIRVVPNAVDPEIYDPSFAPHVPHVVFISNMIERKGVLEFVEAIERLDERNRDVRVSIAGKGRLAEHVERLAETHEHVEYLGYISEERKRALLNEGSIFVLPTYAEGLPIAMLEAMAGGNAIVSTTVGSIPEVIDEEHGVLVEPGDVDGLVEAIDSLVTAPERTANMARANRDAICETYSWSAATDALATLYERETTGSRANPDSPTA